EEKVLHLDEVQQDRDAPLFSGVWRLELLDQPGVFLHERGNGTRPPAPDPDSRDELRQNSEVALVLGRCQDVRADIGRRALLAPGLRPAIALERVVTLDRAEDHLPEGNPVLDIEYLGLGDVGREQQLECTLLASLHPLELGHTVFTEIGPQRTTGL